MFKSTHELKFVSKQYGGYLFIDEPYEEFYIGTCKGLYVIKDDNVYILAVINTCPYNGHFKDVIEWFSHICQDKKSILIFQETFNSKLKLKLITKYGFSQCGNDLIKVFDYQ